MSNSKVGPQLPFSDALHAQKYRGEGESFREAMGRVASALAAKGDEFTYLRDMLLEQRFMPAGRIQSAVGSTRRITPYNCYVSGTLEDSFVEGHGSIMQRACEAAQTMRMGGGIGYDFSTLRPRGADIRKLGSRSSGPVSFMDIFDAVCRCTASSGHRRGAQMGVMRIDHPDIEEFIRAKQRQGHLTGFNVSVAVTDEFMTALGVGMPFKLRFGGQVYREVDPQVIWEAIMRSTWDWAEPGVLFVDAINRMNNLWYAETIAASNPCGEQPLPPYGACLLGSFNLVKYLVRNEPREFDSCGPAIKTWGFDFTRFREDIRSAVRAMDRVIDIATYPLYEQEKEAKSKRRMGLGVTGLANTLEAMGFHYGSEEFREHEEQILEELRDESYRASVALARERGPFPLFDAERYLEGDFIKELPDDIKKDIREHGIRNSHLTSIAPTGTISMCADNVSSGIEPVFEYEFERTIIEFDGPATYKVSDYGYRELGIRGVRAQDVTADQHLGVLRSAQRFVDSAVSKTCNVPSDMPWDDFKRLYVRAWEAGCKGCTTFRVGGQREGVLRKTEEAAPAACYVDPLTGARECG